ncbi:uncharacterized protein STEHIDRAFT_122827 [Stereum hirsutum FP-91666 SS1]|uniref:uncharacterized protein n=1 Tax=Stereum hirsutum (strain FP-91666) TaxID=721885 RepID=UPI0004449F5D|nr:uncharacterized protein STEHIDRAFT_122827 [Stereum hirsutum FP-91666 SS1]EIM84888.1 hypothetical protein STEHIDRAFT_122827 [Stereum hirsutum FP-91666 SS1]
MPVRLHHSRLSLINTTPHLRAPQTSSATNPSTRPATAAPTGFTLAMWNAVPAFKPGRGSEVVATSAVVAVVVASRVPDATPEPLAAVALIEEESIETVNAPTEIPASSQYDS